MHFAIKLGIACVCTLSLGLPGYAWEGHGLITYLALRSRPALQQPIIPAEPLAVFLQATRQPLSQLLAENEKWSQTHIPYYPPLPTTLAFNRTQVGVPLGRQFVESLRINPTMHFPLFVSYMPQQPHRIHGHPMTKANILVPSLLSNPTLRIPDPPLEGVQFGQVLTPLEILVSAADEPDFGMDTQLWEDNPSTFGQRYGWGLQPFGNNQSVLMSQVPFHIGYYHEARVLYWLAPYLQYTYPEYRIHLFLALSRFAFDKGHPYWGYRFLGWALHYVQDLAQPYHASLLPNYPLQQTLWLWAWHAIWPNHQAKDVIQLISNKHAALENYHYMMMRHSLMSGSPQAMVSALAASPLDSVYPPYSDAYPREVITANAYREAATLDELLARSFPMRYVADPNYPFYLQSPTIDLFAVTEAYPNPALLHFKAKLAQLMSAVGAHTRHVVDMVIR